MASYGVGLLGCGTISDRYIEAAERFDAFDVVACADLDLERAAETAREFGIETSGPPDIVLEHEDVDIVVNLTPPAVHAATTIEALEAGHHVYTEKPLAESTDRAREILETAEDTGRLVGCAPDTFLGRGLQTTRNALDEGRIGDPIGATAFFTSGGHEHWHPHPEIFYRSGGGPLFDMGPYYVTALVALLGSARTIAGSTTRAQTQRQLGLTEASIAVEVPTHEVGLVTFESDATASLLFSFDVPASEIAPQNGFEIHGTEGTLLVPDPNHFDGPVQVRTHDMDEWEELPLVEGPEIQQRGLGILDLVRAVSGQGPHRTSGELGFHVLEILEGVRMAGAEEAVVRPDSSISRPEPFPGNPNT